ncbi:replication initiation protein RepC [Paenirhodobacter populi]|uniref:Uncharacterized protein n=1 Tax=Paenirhodobacter populi TaxID=2306993 RepID=A0A443JR48_9RHOB|nr:replication initiation protein RepC [Sinirhodobacter populi]RWR22966.1 hypothetical protein D2T30_04885 [Sinirhodobacter populi]
MMHAKLLSSDSFTGPHAVLPDQLQRSDIEGLLIDLRSALQLSPARLDALLAMMRRTRPSDWTNPDADAVCYAQQQQVAADLGKSTRALRNDEADLVRRGLIERRTFGTGRRCMITGNHGHRFGLSFTPLIRQIGHLLDLRDIVHRERRQQQALRLVCSALRQEFRRCLARLQLVGSLDDAVLALTLRFSDWPRRFENMGFAELEAHRVEVESALREANEISEAGQSTSGRPEVDVRQSFQDSTKDKPESCSCREQVEAAFATALHGTTPTRKLEVPVKLPEFTPSQLYSLSSEEMRLWIDCFRHDRPRPVATDILQAAVRRVPEMGINEAAWREAADSMGPMKAALAILVIDSNQNHPVTPVRNPGGLLRVFTRLDSKGRLNLQGSLFGLYERSRLPHATQ